MVRGLDCVQQGRSSVQQVSDARAGCNRGLPLPQQLAAVPLRTVRPTAQLPCLTASMAYSTWNRRPWGLHVVTSVSYCGGRRVAAGHAWARTALSGERAHSQGRTRSSTVVIGRSCVAEASHTATGMQRLSWADPRSSDSLVTRGHCMPRPAGQLQAYAAHTWLRNMMTDGCQRSRPSRPASR